MLQRANPLVGESAVKRVADHTHDVTHLEERPDTHQQRQNDGERAGAWVVWIRRSSRMLKDDFTIRNCLHNAQYRSAANIISNTFSMLSWLNAYLTEWILYAVPSYV